MSVSGRQDAVTQSNERRFLRCGIGCRIVTSNPPPPQKNFVQGVPHDYVSETVGHVRHVPFLREWDGILAELSQGRRRAMGQRVGDGRRDANYLVAAES